MTRFAPLGLAAALSCHAPPPPPLPTPAEPAAAMLGRWEYIVPSPDSRTRAEGPALGAGLIVALQFDSASGRRFSGRVVTWFAGDLGLSSSMFGPVAGEISDSGTASFTIPLAKTQTGSMFVAGVLRGDTLAIKTARQGQEPGPFSDGAVFVRARRD